MHADRADRLRSCFDAVFPNIDRNAITSATPESIADWDSIHHVTLVGVIEEEFGIMIDPEDLDRLNSWQSFLAYLEKQP